MKSVEEPLPEIIEQHLIRHWMYFKHTQENITVDYASLKYIFAHPYNRILHADWLDKEKQYRKIEIDKLLKCYDREGEPLMWIVGPSTKPLDIDKTLLKMRFRHHENWTGMAINLTTNSAKNNNRDDFEFKRVNNVDDLKKWVDVYVNGYQKPTNYKEVILNRFEQIIKNKQNEYQLYLGLYKSEPAVSGTLFFDSDIAGLYCITTAPNMRRKGLATAYLQNLLHAAHQQGASLCILHATEVGRPTYEKLGFTSSCMFRVYLYKDPDGIK